MMTPPATCDSQPSLLTIMPQSCTATILVQRTTPVSVSTRTSAIWTPPTPVLETPGLTSFLSASTLVDSAKVQKPCPLAWSMPSLAQASFQDQLFLLALSTTLSFSIARSSTLAPSLGAILANKSSRAAVAATSVAGACDGQVVLPPEPDDEP